MATSSPKDCLETLERCPDPGDLAGCKDACCDVIDHCCDPTPPPVVPPVVPPVTPPPPPAPVYPIYGLNLVGDFPAGGLFGGTKRVTLTGAAVPTAGSLAPSVAVAGPASLSVNWWALALDVRRLVADLAPAASALPLVRQLISDVTARRWDRIPDDLQAIEAAVPASIWSAVAADLRAVLADLGVPL